MTILQRSARNAAAALALAATLGACANSSLGNVLGGVLGGNGGGSQVSGVVRGVDTRNQQIVLQTQDGQSVGLYYDNQTQVVYQNQQYSVTNLERGDQVTARIQQTNNGGYYTDLVQVDQSVSGPTTGTAGGTYNSVQALQGTVRQVSTANGWFTMDVGNSTLEVTLPYNPRRADVDRFNSLRRGDYVRIYGVFVNNSRVELRQFY
jgi:exosome complex RNA-binding protein Csl4